MEENDFNLKIAIVGLGLIGGSFGKALRHRRKQDGSGAYRIHGVDKNINSIKQALELGIIDDGYTEGEKGILDADLIILALYPEDTIQFVKRYRSSFKRGAVITDVCGIKQKLMEEILEIIPEGIEFVGGHPMAGKELSGIEHASSHLFDGSSYIITPHENNSPESIELVEKMARMLGCSNIVKTSPIQHDRIISFTSQLPHLLAVSLMNSVSMSENAVGFVGGSFRDATRVAEINSELWAQLFLMNADTLVNEVELFEAILSEIKNSIKNRDLDSLNHYFKKAEQERKRISKMEQLRKSGGVNNEWSMG